MPRSGSATALLGWTSRERHLTEQGIIQRAFSLAGSGRFRDVGELEKALRREGFTQVTEHLTSRSLRTQLKALMAQRPEIGTPSAQ